MVQCIKRILFGMVLAFLTLFAAPGDLDISFGSGGKVTTDFSGNADILYSAAIQSDGKIIAAGRTEMSSPGVNQDFALARYNTDGSLDTTFGSGGKVTTDFAGNNDQIESLVLQSDGKIVAAGQAFYDASNGYINFALARYNTDGSLDTTFGSGGKVTTDFTGNHDYGRSVTLQDDGKILMAGQVNEAPPGAGWQNAIWNIALVRYNADGSLDTTFGSGGKVTTDIYGTIDGVESISVQRNGKIVVMGSSSEAYGDGYSANNLAMTRYNVDGSLDTTFGSGGKVMTYFSGTPEYYRGFAFQSDNKIVVGGYIVENNSHDFVLKRYNTDGSLDTTFGSGGRVTTNFGGTNILYSITIQNDGKIVATGYISSQFALARYNIDGSLDTTFGSGGKVTTDFGGSSTGKSVLLQGDGKIVVAGEVSGDFGLARYESDPANKKPVAYAGADQAIILLNTEVQLDGTGSYDEDGDAITYAWNITQKPTGSSTTLSNPASATPTFTPDVYGDYVIELTVSDPTETGSTDSVTISFDNVQPVGNAGGNKSILVGDTAVLDGTGSSDANGDSLTYSWSFVSKPIGSNAILSDSTSATASFVADVHGTYDVNLIVNDGLLDSELNTANILVITVVNAITQVLNDAMDTINNIPPAALKNPNMANALTKKINTVIQMIEKEKYQGALKKLTKDILTKTDGCANGGQPDKNDWIITCGEQDAVYSFIMEAISIIDRQL